MSLEAFFERRRRLNATRNKTRCLTAILRSRGLPGRVYYSRRRYLVGWLHCWRKVEQLLGADYAEAVDLIESGTMDFMRKGGP